MTEALEEVKTGEVTHAIKDSKDAHGNPIKDGDVMGITDGSIEVVGSDIGEVTLELLETMNAEDADTLTLLAGSDMKDDDFAQLTAEIENRYNDLEVDAHRGDQPLYPIVLSVE
jgi:dihydroxyacetone kinase-like predicted kinase